MSFNLVVWKWTEDYDTSTKRRKLKTKYGDVMSAFAESESHPAMCEHDFSSFVADVDSTVGPSVDGEPYILEPYPCAIVYNMGYSRVEALVPVIGNLARKHGLTSAEC